jgi:uncharacterized protein (TIGR00369 family)
MNQERVRELLDRMAPWVRALGLEPVEVSDTEVVLRLPFSGDLRHGSGVICGQVYSAAADTAMIIAISAALGDFRPMSTVAINTQLMRTVRTGDLLIKARVLRTGRHLVFGEVCLYDDIGALAAHVTTTYALAA